MSDPAGDLVRREMQIAHRLVRLFRVERSGRLMRRPAATARRLIDRRGHLIEELTRLEEQRRLLAPSVSDSLDAVMSALAQEADRGEQRCLEFLAEIGARLSALRGEGTASGLRGHAGGQLLGRG